MPCWPRVLIMSCSAIPAARPQRSMHWNAAKRRRRSWKSSARRGPVLRSRTGWSRSFLALRPAIADWTATHRSLAEPFLNAWAAKLLGNPDRVRCVVERVNTTTGAVVDKQDIRLKSLQLAPLDVIHAQESTEDSRLSELEQRILFLARRNVALTATQTLRLNPSRDPAWPTTDVSWSEFTEVVRAARNLLAGGRALRAGDINIADVAPTVLDAANLKVRADRALASLRQLQTTLQTALNGATPTTLAPLRSVMHTIAAFGIPGAIPLSVVGQTEADLKTLVFQARSIDREATDRLAKADAATDSAERLRHLFGNSFVALPRFRSAESGRDSACSGREHCCSRWRPARRRDVPSTDGASSRRRRAPRRCAAVRRSAGQRRCTHAPGGAASTP